MGKPDDIRAAVAKAAQVYESGNRMEALKLLSDIDFDEEGKGDPLYAWFLCVRGSAHAELRQLEPAAEAFEEALEFYRIRNATSKMALIHFNLGNVHKYASRHQEAEEHYQKSIACFEEVGETMTRLLVWLSLGNMLADHGDWDRSRECLKETDALLPDDSELHPDVLWSKRSLQVKMAIIDGKEDLAVELGRQAVEAGARLSASNYEAESLVLLSETLARRGETREARRLALRARELLTSPADRRGQDILRRARAAVVKIDNLDFAFGTPPRPGRGTKKSKTIGAHPRKKRGTAETPPPAASKADLPPLLVAKGVYKDKDNFLNLLAQAPKVEGGGGKLFVFFEMDAFISVLDGTEAVVIEALTPSTWERIEEDWALSALGANALQQITPQLCYSAIDLQSMGLVEPALLHHALALRMAIRLQNIQGLVSITGNIFRLAKRIYTHVKHKGSAPFIRPDKEHLTIAGGTMVLSHGEPQEEEKLADRLLEFVRVEAAWALSAIQKINAWSETAADPQLRLSVLRSLRRLRSLARVYKNQSLLREICELCEEAGDTNTALESIYEELADVNLLDILQYAGGVIMPSSDEPDSAAGAVQPEFQSTWELYLAWRHRITGDEPQTVSTAAFLALDAFDVLRADAVAGGAAFGHRLSYMTIQFPVRISRDAIQMLIKGGTEEHMGALWLAEGACSRALVDWMGRTHFTNRLVIRKSISGSLGEVQNASVSKIFSAAAESQTVILYYVAVADGYVMWAIHPDGDWDCIHLEDVAPELLTLFRTLPYTFGSPDFAHAKSAAADAARERQALPLDPLLLDLGKRLLPEPVRAKLEAGAAKRIAIIADQMMQFVPFACLRLDESSYFIDKFDIGYWPSVTAWILCRQTEKLYTIHRDDALDSVVVGAPDFSTRFPIYYRGVKQNIKLEELPGARDEAMQVASILGVEPRLASEATFEAIHDYYYADDIKQPATRKKKPRRKRKTKMPKGESERYFPFVPVLHLATHALTDTWDADQSFIAFSDRLLTADFLYTFDPGFLTRLIMLSCCQTAVGFTHPDSVIGLASAFFVAGACTVGSTLWNVEDSATSTLMSRFYEEIKAGEDVASAMRTAQNHLRSFPLWSHPLYWAPFRIAGSFANPFDHKASSNASE